MKTVIITIDKRANVEIEVQGVKGAACKDITRAVEEALGKVTSTEQTGEYYEQSGGESVHIG